MDQALDAILAIALMAATIGAVIGSVTVIRRNANSLWLFVGRACIGSSIASGIAGIVIECVSDGMPDAILSAPIFAVIAAILGLPAGLIIAAIIACCYAIHRWASPLDDAQQPANGESP